MQELQSSGTPTILAYRFGPFRLNVRDRILEKAGERIAVTPKVVDTLLVLVEHAGEVLSKEALMQAVWPDVTVVESGLSRNISVLRKAIEADDGPESYIETVPKRGYRFVHPLEVDLEPGSEAQPMAEADESPSVLERIPMAPASYGTRIPAPLAAASLGAVLLLAAVLAIVWMRPGPQALMVHAQEPEVQIGNHLLYKLNPRETERAARYFREAVLRNPASAEANAGLALAMVNLSTLGVVTPGEVLPEAREAVRRAMEQSPDSADVHTASAVVQTIALEEPASAETAFRRAMELDPANVQTRFYYARFLQMRGDVTGARSLLEEAIELDPVSPALGAQYGQLLYFLRDFEAAAATCRQVLDREPGYALAHYYLALSLGHLGRYEEAAKNLASTRLSPHVLEVDLAWLRALQGDIAPARKALADRRELLAAGKIPKSALLLPAILAGDQETALEAVQAIVERRTAERLSLAVDPRLDPVRKHPSFPALLQRAGLRDPVLSASLR